MNVKTKQSVENYIMALAVLSDFIREPIKSDRDRAGIIKSFEFTFELAWKTFQKMAASEGMEGGGPRSALKNAFKMNLIHNNYEVQTWLSMLDDRNLAAHTYRQEISIEIVERIINDYEKCFLLIRERFEKLK